MKTINLNALKTSKIHLFLLSLNNVYLVLLFVFMNYLVSISFSALSNLVSDKSLSDAVPSTPENKMETFVLVVIAAPLLETFIFQYGIIEWLRQKKSLLFCCFSSALAFALVHLYDVYYFFLAFVAGLLMAYLYTLKKTIIAGISITIITHSLYNALVYILTRVI